MNSTLLLSSQEIVDAGSNENMVIIRGCKSLKKNKFFFGSGDTIYGDAMLETCTKIPNIDTKTDTKKSKSKSKSKSKTKKKIYMWKLITINNYSSPIKFVRKHKNTMWTKIHMGFVPKCPACANDEGNLEAHMIGPGYCMYSED